MTIQSELKKLVDLDTYKESKDEDGSLRVFARTAEQTGVELAFTPETVKDNKPKALAKIIADHLGIF